MAAETTVKLLATGRGINRENTAQAAVIPMIESIRRTQRTKGKGNGKHSSTWTWTWSGSGSQVVLLAAGQLTWLPGQPVCPGGGAGGAEFELKEKPVERIQIKLHCSRRLKDKYLNNLIALFRA